MIIKSQKQIIPNNDIPPPKIISRIKIHPSLTEQTHQTNLINLLARRSSQSKFNQAKKRRNSQDDPTWRSKVYLRPIISRSVQKQINLNDSTSFFSNRSNKKLLALKHGANQRREKNLMSQLPYNYSKDEITQIKSIKQQFYGRKSENLSEKAFLDVEQQFYQQVRIYQAFKSLNRIAN